MNGHRVDDPGIPTVSQRNEPSTGGPTAGPLRIGGRVAQIAGTLGVRSLRLGWSWTCALVGGKPRNALAGPWLVETITDLGPAFIKVAQMLSTRRDLVSPAVCRTLSGLYDEVRPIPVADLLPVLERHFGRTVTDSLRRDNTTVAAGSIACVYRATLPDGRAVAVKVRRPGIERTLGVDLAIMRKAARLLARLPALRGVPVVEIVTQLTESVYEQIDLISECDKLELLGTGLAVLPGVRIPQVYRHLSGENIVVMEFIEDLHRYEPHELAEEQRKHAVVSALHAAYQMLFKNGLVHCDLHPGNLYLRQDGTVVIVDAGFTVRLRPQAQDKFASFFHHMTKGNGHRCAEIVLSTATCRPGADTAGFRREISTLVEASTGARAAEFDLINFATRLFDIQRRYGLYADPQFVFPILSLLVLEGTVRDFAPDVDFQREAVPFLIEGALERTIGAWEAKQASRAEADRQPQVAGEPG